MRSRRAFFVLPAPPALPGPSRLAARPATRHGLRLRDHPRCGRCRVARFLLQAALNAIDAIEAQLTVFRDTSAISVINRRAADEDVACDAELFALLSRCDRADARHRRRVRHHQHAAQPVLGVSSPRRAGAVRQRNRRCARSRRDEPRRPRRPTIRASDSSSQASTLNLGAIGKGYALDRVPARCGMRQVHHALLSAGRSSLLAIGGRGRGWPVDIVSPRRQRPIARVWIRDAALGTSGAGEQFVVVDGRRFGHVLDPRTGLAERRHAERHRDHRERCRCRRPVDRVSRRRSCAGPALLRASRRRARAADARRSIAETRS